VAQVVFTGWMSFQSLSNERTQCIDRDQRPDVISSTGLITEWTLIYTCWHSKLYCSITGAQKGRETYLKITHSAFLAASQIHTEAAISFGPHILYESSEHLLVINTTHSILWHWTLSSNNVYDRKHWAIEQCTQCWTFTVLCAPDVSERHFP